MYLANSYLKCHETKIEIKRSLHELLGWFFALSTRLAPPLFKIARLIVWWHYGGDSNYIEIDIIFIFLQKIFNSLNSIAENLIIALTIGKTMCICEIYLSQIVSYLAHLHEDPLGGSQHPPPKPPAYYSDRYSQLIFPFFDHWRWFTEVFKKRMITKHHISFSSDIHVELAHY